MVAGAGAGRRRREAGGRREVSSVTSRQGPSPPVVARQRSEASGLPGEGEALTKPGPAPPLLSLEAQAGTAFPRPSSAAFPSPRPGCVGLHLSSHLLPPEARCEVRPCPRQPV